VSLCVFVSFAFRINLSQRSTKDPGQKVFSFVIGQGNVIKGWDEGVLQMQIGENVFFCMIVLFLKNKNLFF
jgi:FKBP-type peptidyl-prolyl cis-trans isomerase 2